jgi:SAM-dependent methyltransferase
MIELRHRHRQPELMDQPNIPLDEHSRALQGLARLNQFSGTVGSLFHSLCDAQTQWQSPTLRILDIATGSADVLASLAKRSGKAGLDWQLTGCDISETALEVARNRKNGYENRLNFFRHDVLKQSFPVSLRDSFDVVLCSLFLHHLSDAEAIYLLGELAALRPRMILINDLSRSRVNFLLVSIASWLLSRSHIVHVDGPLSVRAAFTPKEALALASRAGLSGAIVTEVFPCRWILTWRRS